MTSRDEIVTLLVLRKPLTLPERRALGAGVTREEVVRAIEGQLDRFPRFPAESDGGSQILLAPTGVHLLSRRRTSHASHAFASLRDAVERYVDQEIGPSLGGVRVKPATRS